MDELKEISRKLDDILERLAALEAKVLYQPPMTFEVKNYPPPAPARTFGF